MTLKTACTVLLLGFPAAAFGQVRDTVATRSRPVQTGEATACCRVVRLEAATGQVTARETATGYTFRFAVKDRRLRAAIRIGDAVWADFATKAVKLRTSESEPCCSIVEMPSPNTSDTPQPPEL